MEICIKNPYDFGSKFYSVESKDRNVYKPCTLCNNTRKYDISEGEEVFSIACPKCEKKSIKGDLTRNKLSLKAFSLETWELCEIKLSPDDTIFIIRKSGNPYSASRRLDLNTLTDKGSFLFPNQYYCNQKEARAEVRRLNAEQKKLEEDFLRSDDCDSEVP